MDINITIQHVSEMVGVSHSLTRGIEFELENTTVLYDRTLPPLWSIPIRMIISLSMV